MGVSRPQLRGRVRARARVYTRILYCVPQMEPFFFRPCQRPVYINIMQIEPFGLSIFLGGGGGEPFKFFSYFIGSLSTACKFTGMPFLRSVCVCVCVCGGVLVSGCVGECV